MWSCSVGRAPELAGKHVKASCSSTHTKRGYESATQVLATHPDAEAEADALEHALRDGLGRRVGRVAAGKLRRVVPAQGQPAQLRQRFA